MTQGSWCGWCDGACRGNPGPAGIGGLVRNPSGEVVAAFSQPIGRGTNNDAEWQALLHLVELAGACGADRLHVRSDSQLVVYQYTGAYAINHAKFARLRALVQRAAGGLHGGMSIEWTPRDGNREADALASRAVAMPQMPLGHGGAIVVPWVPVARCTVPGVPEHPMARVLASGDAKFSVLRSLRVTDGRDACSSLRGTSLQQAVTTRWGSDSTDWLLAALGALSDTDYGRNALRWAARGLPPPVALKKASVDAEMSSVAQRCRQRRSGRASSSRRTSSV